jgi:hypothetical protein
VVQSYGATVARERSPVSEGREERETKKDEGSAMVGRLVEKSWEVKEEVY